MVSVFSRYGIGNLKFAISPNNFHFRAVGCCVRSDFHLWQFWQFRPVNWGSVPPNRAATKIDIVSHCLRACYVAKGSVPRPDFYIRANQQQPLQALWILWHG